MLIQRANNTKKTRRKLKLKKKNLCGARIIKSLSFHKYMTKSRIMRKIKKRSTGINLNTDGNIKINFRLC